MKSYSYIIKLFVILLLILILLFNLSGCKNIAANEVSIQEQQDITKEEEAEEEEKTVAETTTEQNSVEDAASDEENIEEEIKGELFLTLNNFFEAVKEDKEYEFFDSYTRNMVGSEEEYRNGTKSDIFYIVKESHSSWRNVKAESVIFDGSRAILTVIGDRTAEGIEYAGEEVKFKFINEEGSWKIDFYYPLDILIIPVNPEPDSVINSAGITTLTISAEIKSFFTISDIRLQLNDTELNSDINGEDRYEQDISVEIAAENLTKGLNKATCYAADEINRKADYDWSFTVE